MLCIGSVYAWSIIAKELIEDFNFSASQSQIIFGTVISIFPITMVLVGQIAKKIKHKYFGYISGILFYLGYTLASHSQGNFYLILLGIGVLAGIATGFGYWVAFTTPVQWFPKRKGLITGIAAAGFGLGAVFMSEGAELFLIDGNNVLQLLQLVGILYGLIIVVFSILIFQNQKTLETKEDVVEILPIIRSKVFRKLFLGIFLGTFAGLLIIGSLRIIGSQYNISNHHLILGIIFFAMANFSGRLIWGFISDYLGARVSLFAALLFQSVSVIALIMVPLSDFSFLVISFLIGFGFGGNFVLFAKATLQEFGLKKLGLIYPYVFLGYAIAGIAGPISGGALYDLLGSFTFAIILASCMSLIGSLLFLPSFCKLETQKKMKTEKV